MEPCPVERVAMPRDLDRRQSFVYSIIADMRRDPLMTSPCVKIQKIMNAVRKISENAGQGGCQLALDGKMRIEDANELQHYANMIGESRSTGTRSVRAWVHGVTSPVVHVMILVHACVIGVIRGIIERM